MNIKAIRKYIESKLHTVYDDDVQDWRDVYFVDSRCILENAVKRFSEKYNLSFFGFDYDNRNGEWCQDLKFCLPDTVENIFSYETNIGRRNPAEAGLFIHIFNQQIDDLDKYISKFSQINGEVCVSNLDDAQFKLHKSVIGVALQGQPTATFPADCWSYTGKDGKRYATKDTEFEGNLARQESWMIPSDCEIFAIVCSPDWSDKAEKTDFSVWDITLN